MNTEHQHEKVYNKNILLTHPPKRQWICKLCGKMGTDLLSVYDTPEYDRVWEWWYGEEEK